MESAELKSRIDLVALDPTATPDPYVDVESILDAAEEHLLLPAVISATEPGGKSSGVDLARYYLNGFARLRLGDRDPAYKVLVPLGSKLEQEGHWRALGLLGARALEYAPRLEAALEIAKAIESAGFDLLDPAFLQRAYDNFPDEPRLSFLMGEWHHTQAQKAGLESEAGKKSLFEARSYWADALDGYVAQKRFQPMDDLLLRLIEAEELGLIRRVLNAIKKLGTLGQWAKLWPSLDLALPALRRSGLAPELWHHLLHILPEAPDSAVVRKLLTDLAPDAFPQVDGIADILVKSGVLDATVKIEAAMKSLEPLLALAPGFHVLHASWGVGLIRLNDGESVVLDFAGTPGHRMSISLARRALQVLRADDLRVLKAEHPEQIKKMIKENPAEVAYLAIRQRGVEATTQEVKRILLDGVMTASQFTTWWKEAKVAMEGDDRFDLSQAFRQSYRIREVGADDDDQIALPIIEPRRGIRPNLNLIRRFLEQHPDEVARAARTYSGILDRWARQERTNAEDRMAIYLQLYRWKKEVTPEFLEALTDMLSRGIEASTFADLEDQRLIASVGLGRNELWKDAACFALSSRNAEVRELALDKMRDDLEVGRSLLRELMQDPAARPLASLTAIDLAVIKSRKEEPLAPDPWEAALGASTLVEATSREQVRKMALGLLDTDGHLAKQMLKSPPSDVMLDRFAMLIRKWRSSERFLYPVIELLRQAGHGEMVKSVRSERMERTNQLLIGSAEHIDYSGHFMTRITFDRLKRELERLNLELRTTVAQAIQKARELGDLRENAEYESAKMKQASHAERIASLTARLQQARLIDDLTLPPGQIGPGTEVELENAHTHERKRLWILGEGDDQFGPEVISYAAPLGQGLLGKKPGERLSLMGSEGVTELIVISVHRRLPETPAVGAADVTSETPAS
ncbi:MAG: GreA/GreB family elongation factor [Candidatus Eisenbacteria bacterium]|nr:GreA/GreB family elongation factor [Candidatus Eisenbacteria bacterium]MCC7140938.1 GreA/GreB family elongation factor [Candidatus Eisenbacteria bacterium]